MSFHDIKYIELGDSKTVEEKRGVFTVKKLVLLVFAALAVGLFHPSINCFTGVDTVAKTDGSSFSASDSALCPIPSKVPIKEHDAIQYILTDNEYKKDVIERFSKSLQIETVIYDDTTDYSEMQKFHDYLEESFPLVYKTADVYKINTYGLVFHFPGSNEDLKPIMLAAHMDTVPIGDPSDWKESPFSGRFDGDKFHGRGASDCKNLLVGLMEAAEKLIADGKSNFERGVILAFGYDEEASGWQGAHHIGEFIEKKFGANSIEAIVDEGPVMFLDFMGDYYSMIISGEKGYSDLTVEVDTPGGHSSLPKDHTSIGMISKFIYDYENDPFEAILVPENPMMGFFECAAEQGHLPKPLADAGKNARFDEKARDVILSYSHDNTFLKYLLRTSQAIDIINGGDKANSLPRSVSAVINHRIVYGNDVDTVWSKAAKHGTTVAKKYNIGLTVNDEVLFPETENGNMVISYFGPPLKTAKPTSTKSEFWGEFTGLIKSFYEDEVYPEKFETGSKNFIITPSIMTGNTDTRHYWNLTDNIFRVQPGSLNMFEANVHGPNEWVDLETHLQSISFYYNYISHFSIKEE
ncbi:hypothetical protein PICMEDRAFT_18345 [Pichia membranifaciens NRRL Y-2026]|uniref:Uncharacterized protein n=1 Tax=Pichia membranifaciens NRRL Y-2026 TaxID=763406 RepID=A0A1E3NGH3_9ASCO|nr:hypothetical protein PICMEDRAFT_18345 [Pichia membranifaciens NRRL Y-2026]ODQ44443.1 hypothetical protein PICMEDRAFT_18345 [Pichia membranifaciens NRRL Y-2026]